MTTPRVRAEMMLRMFKTSLSKIPSDNNEDGELYGNRFGTIDQVTDYLIRCFQRNPLFTPDFAGENPEIHVHTIEIARNPSWSPQQVVELTIESGASPDQRRDVARNLRISRTEPVHECVCALVGEQPEGNAEDSRYVFQGTAKTQPVSLESLVRFVRETGGFIHCTKYYRVIENVMCNPNIPFETVIHLAAQTGVPEAETQWVKNPFRTYNTEYDACNWFRNKNPVNIKKLLDCVVSSHDHVRELIHAEPHQYVPCVFNCLLSLISANPVWDSQMEVLYGGVVWSLMWDVLGEMYAIQGSPLNDAERRDIRDYLHHRNPSWCLSRRLCQLYADNEVPDTLLLHRAPAPYDELCSTVTMGDGISLTMVMRDHFRYYFQTGFAHKKTLRTKDIRWFAHADMLFYSMASLADCSTLWGDAGERIADFIFRRWVIPRRRRRAIQKVRVVLHSAQERCTNRVVSYHHATSAIASFLTV